VQHYTTTLQHPNDLVRMYNYSLALFLTGVFATFVGILVMSTLLHREKRLARERATELAPAPTAPPATSTRVSVVVRATSRLVLVRLPLPKSRLDSRILRANLPFVASMYCVLACGFMWLTLRQAGVIGLQNIEDVAGLHRGLEDIGR
jgi:hypothetical protein